MKHHKVKWRGERLQFINGLSAILLFLVVNFFGESMEIALVASSNVYIIVWGVSLVSKYRKLNHLKDSMKNDSKTI